jgi:hypothetical protein
MVETENNQIKEVEQVGLNLVSETLPQVTENLALPEIGITATMTEADAKNQEDQRIINKFANDPLEYDDLNQALSTTIQDDENVKIPLFLAELSTFTDKSQKNVILTGESSVGKTHNITQTLWYFRNLKSHAIIEINDATPRSLIYSPNAILVDERTLESIDLSKAPQKGDTAEKFNEWNEKRKYFAYYLDLSQKILVLYDMKNFDLYKNLRSILSHDPTENDCRIYTYLSTDKSPTGGHKTKKILMKGYLTAILASACTEIDEQEISRNYLLSPSDNPDKIKKAIELQTKELSDPKFQYWYENDPLRVGLRKRVQSVEDAEIKRIQFKVKDADS